MQMKSNSFQIRPLVRTLAVTALLVSTASAFADTTEDLLDKLKEKGVLSDEEYKELRTQTREQRRERALKEATQAEKLDKAAAATTLKRIQLFGDLRLRYEDRVARSDKPIAATSAATSPVSTDSYDRQRERYAFRLGVKGEVNSELNYLFRLDTSTNSRSAWVTFGDSASSASNPAPFTKQSGGVNVGQAFLEWKPNEYFGLTGGKMANPLYTSLMVWDQDLSPEGVAARGKFKVNDNFTTFVTFGEFVYQDYSSSPSGTSYSVGFGKQNLFLQAFEVGGQYQFNEKSWIRAAVNSYNYTGHKGAGGFDKPFTGQPTSVAAGNFNDSSNQIGVNNLQVIELPFEWKFPLLGNAATLFGNFAKNSDAAARATAAGKSAYGGEDKALQIGFAIGSDDQPIGLNQGLVLRGNAKKGAWEVRTFYQKVEQFALDPNMVDSDFFEGRTNMKGQYFAAAYSPMDDVITTFRYGIAKRANSNLGTGGFNGDLPLVNPITDWKILQLDVTLRF